MERLRCLCGVELAAPEASGLFPALREHVDQAHPYWKLPDVALQRVLARRAEMAPWDGRSLELPGELEVRPVGPDRLGDFLEFFDHEAFRDNPFWASCYCMEPHLTGPAEEWVRRTTKQNRTEKAELIRQGEAHGYLAYAGGRTVGWCHAAPRLTLKRLEAKEEFRVEDPEDVGSVYCFVIAPPYRGQGVAARLLDAACEGFRARGMRVAEAYPPRETKSAAGGYHGPLSLYLAAGFRPYREGKRTVIVRKQLAI